MVAIGNRNGIKEKKRQFSIFEKKELSVTTDAYNNRLFFLLPSQSTHLIFVWCLSLRFVQTRIRFFRFFFFLIPNLCLFFFLCPTTNIKHWTNTWWEKKKNKQTQTHYYNNHFRVDFFSPISYLNFIRSSGNILYSFFHCYVLKCVCEWVYVVFEM